MHGPAPIDDGVRGREPGHSWRGEGGLLELHHAQGIPLDRAVRVEERH